jgi:hypothetical protein
MRRLLIPVRTVFGVIRNRRTAIKFPLVLAVSFVLWSGCSKKPTVQEQTSDLQGAFGESNRYVTIALSAIRTNDYPAAVIALESAKAMPGITAEQLESLQHARDVMTADLVDRADKGDVKAQADLEAIERSRSQ